MRRHDVASRKAQEAIFVHSNTQEFSMGGIDEVEKKKNNPKHETPHSIVDRYLASLIKNLIPCLSDQV
jgi:hypothetical protein